MKKHLKKIKDAICSFLIAVGFYHIVAVTYNEVKTTKKGQFSKCIELVKDYASKIQSEEK